ncbi:50S ribosomal protein L13 [Candidatus Peregrinibacteria bacterium]|nr:50S ribosomal protein L13 [Candidatus Peregrinibacteria bacterium]
MKTSVPPTPAATWHLIDASGKSLGRVASRVALILKGKHQATYSPHKPSLDHVIIMNVEQLHFSTAKLGRKTYHTHSGYLGSMKTIPLAKLFDEKPEEVMRRAIRGMLPYNRLRPGMLKRLHVVKGTDHPYAPQKPVSLSL